MNKITKTKLRHIRSNIAYTILFLLFSFSALAQNRYTLSGRVTDSISQEFLSSINIIVTNIENTGVISNQYGFYSITLEEGVHSLEVNFLGYKTIRTEIVLSKDTNLDFTLVEDVEALDEVVVTEDTQRNKNLLKPIMSTNKITSKSILRTPTALGEPDVVKSLLLLPGVSNTGESSSGFNVRGGASDQNLVLMDEAIVFNTSHVFGFFSIFNPDSVKDLTLYKGGIPAKYGGRVSSVLDIYQKEGNYNEFHGKGTVGLIFSRLMLEGPIIPKKSSFMIGGRSSYAHIFLPLFDIEDTKLYFYDLNTKVNYKFNRNNILYASGYFGRDVFDISNLFINTYGNSFVNLRWNHIYNEKIFSNLSLIYSDYFFGFGLRFVGFEWNTNIYNFNVKYDFKHYISNNVQLSYGLGNIYYKFNPGEITPTSDETEITYNQLTQKYANELGLYFGVNQKISKKINVYYGFRISNFLRLGQDAINVYQDDNPLLFDKNTKVYYGATPISEDTSTPSILSDFTNIEPRATVSYAIDENTSIKASYNRMTQYIHLLSNTSSQTPLDVYTPSGPFVKPQLLDQYALGFFKQFNLFSLEAEVFYKGIENRIDYINGADLIGNNAIERVILNGEARSYGLELLIDKNINNFNFRLAYTILRSEQRVPGRTTDEIGINNGNWYLTAYDKTHDLSFSGSYAFNKNWLLTFNFIYQTGRPETYPDAVYIYRNSLIPSYNNRNTNRIPDYHRADISIIHNPKKNNNKKFKSEWIFGIYNIYNRKNANSVTFQYNTDNQKNEAVKTSIFGIVPSISYNLKF